MLDVSFCHHLENFLYANNSISKLPRVPSAGEGYAVATSDLKKITIGAIGGAKS